MYQLLTGLDPNTLTPWGLVTVLIVFLFTGRVVIRAAYDDVRRERDNYRQSNEYLLRTLDEQSRQMGTLLEYARSADYVLRSLPIPGAGHGPDVE